MIKRNILCLLTGLIVLFAMNDLSAEMITYFNPGVEPDGFRGIKWGQSLDSVEGMKQIGVEVSDSGSMIYKKERDRLKLGYVELEKIEYYFWKDRFSKVVIYVKGPANWKGLQEATFERFGRGYQPESTKEDYAWYGNTTRMLLSYDEKEKRGILTMFSREISILQQKNDW